MTPDGPKAHDTKLPNPTIDGLTWRAPETSDASAIVALQDACCDVDRTYRITESEVLDRWTDPSLQTIADALVGIASDGRIVASIWSYMPGGAESEQPLFGDENQIHPAFRTNEMRDFVLGWWEARGRQRLAEDSISLPARFYAHRFDHQEKDIAFLVSRGYEIVRYYHELGRDLSQPIEKSDLFAELDVRPLREHQAEGLVVHNQSFRDHWGSQPITHERWEHFFTKALIPAASFVVLDGDEPVAYVLCEKYPQDFVDRGWSHGWVSGVGTVRSHRRMGIATALIAQAMQIMVEDGMEYALLGVDSENPTGAYGVYESLGFVEQRRELALTKTA